MVDNNTDRILAAMARGWDEGVAAARKALIGRQGMKAWDADIDILTLENPYRAVSGEGTKDKQ